MRQSEDCYVWRVSSLKDLTRTVIPFFDKFTYQTQIRADFELFKQIVEMTNNKHHLTIEGLQQIVNLKAALKVFQIA